MAWSSVDRIPARPQAAPTYTLSRQAYIRGDMDLLDRAMAWPDMRMAFPPLLPEIKQAVEIAIPATEQLIREAGGQVRHLPCQGKDGGKVRD